MPNSTSLKSSVSVIIDDAKRVCANLQRANIANIKNKQLCQSLEYIVSMLTFFAALCQKCANPPSLKSSVSAIIDDAETVDTDLHRTNVGDMKKNTNRVNPLNIQ